MCSPSSAPSSDGAHCPRPMTWTGCSRPRPSPAVWSRVNSGTPISPAHGRLGRDRRGADTADAIAPALRPAPPPRPITQFIGRTTVVASVTAAVRESRLVTLTGTGGTGKSRVALAVAAELAPEFRQGVAFADLAPITTPSLLGATLLGSLGLSPSAGVDVEAQLAEALAGLSSCSWSTIWSISSRAARVLGRLLTAAPELHILVTSRVPLHLYGEHQFRVPAIDPARGHRSHRVRNARQRSGPVLPPTSASGPTGSDSAR